MITVIQIGYRESVHMFETEHGAISARCRLAEKNGSEIKIQLFNTETIKKTNGQRETSPVPKPDFEKNYILSNEKPLEFDKVIEYVAMFMKEYLSSINRTTNFSEN